MTASSLVRVVRDDRPTDRSPFGGPGSTSEGELRSVRLIAWTFIDLHGDCRLILTRPGVQVTGPPRLPGSGLPTKPPAVAPGGSVHSARGGAQDRSTKGAPGLKWGSSEDCRRPAGEFKFQCAGASGPGPQGPRQHPRQAERWEQAAPVRQDLRLKRSQRQQARPPAAASAAIGRSGSLKRT